MENTHSWAQRPSVSPAPLANPQFDRVSSHSAFRNSGHTFCAQEKQLSSGTISHAGVLTSSPSPFSIWNTLVTKETAVLWLGAPQCPEVELDSDLPGRSPSSSPGAAGPSDVPWEHQAAHLPRCWACTVGLGQQTRACLLAHQSAGCSATHRENAIAQKQYSWVNPGKKQLNYVHSQFGYLHYIYKPS